MTEVEIKIRCLELSQDSQGANLTVAQDLYKWVMESEGPRAEYPDKKGPAHL